MKPVPIASVIGGLLRTIDRVLGTDIYGGLRAGPRLGLALGPDFRARIKIVSAAVALSVNLRRREVRLRVRGPCGPRWFTVPDWSGMLVLEEVFVHDEYAVQLRQQPVRILDVGSNIGASILYFSVLYPDAQIVAVEPSPSLFRILERNVAQLPNVTLCHAAVVASTQPVVFFEGMSSWSGSTRPGPLAPPDRAVWVDGISLDELLSRGHVDLLKIDIEGAEFDVLPRSKALRNVGAVVGEIHAPPGSPETESILALFAEYRILSSPRDTDGIESRTVFSAMRELP
jgi:FkbM family methyltransferase